MNNIRPVTTQDLTIEEMALLPTPNEIMRYDEIGWHISPIIIPENLLDNALGAVEGYYAGNRDYSMASTNGISDDSGNDQVIRNSEFVTIQKKEFQHLGFYKMVVATAAKLAKTDSIRLFADSLISKKPVKGKQKGIVGWHSDKAYWPTCTSDHMLTAWIPLQDVSMDMGPLMYIDHSHKWKDEAKLKSFYSFNNQNLHNFNTYLSKDKPDHSRSFMTIKRGQISFHNCHTIHSSHINTSDKNRVALAVHFQDENNKYKKVFNEEGELIEIGYDKLCKLSPDTDPDYSDENLFPVVFND